MALARSFSRSDTTSASGLHPTVAARARCAPHLSCVASPRRAVECGAAARAATAVAAPPEETAAPPRPLRTERDAKGLERHVYNRDGENFWTWRGHRLHYVVSGDLSSSATPFVLIHGFGASAYHWRYQLPALGAVRPTFALCMVGYGLSAKPESLEYSAELWGACVADFVAEVVGRPSLLAGNSIGAIAVLSAACERPDLVKGLALLNAAGRFDDGKRLPVPPPRNPHTPKELLADAAQRVAAHTIFLFTKYRIPLILKQVYVDQSKVDAQLIASIYDAACDDGAAEAFFRISGAGGRSVRTLNQLLDNAAAPGGRGSARSPIPIALIWGLKDPWMQPAKADQIVTYYPAATFVPIPGAGHCPQDDAPAETNAALLAWAASIGA